MEGVGSKVGKHPTFDYNKLQTLADKQGYTDFVKTIEDQRCKSDLMYRLFKRPESVVDKLLPGLIEIIKTKNSPDVTDSHMFRDAESFLLHHQRVDTKIKLFFTLLVIARETEAQEIIKKGCKTEGNIWEDKWEQHMVGFFKEISKMTNDILFDDSFTEANIQEKVTHFVVSVELAYMSDYK